MKSLLDYLYLVLKQSFSGLFWLFDAIGVGFYILHLKQPGVPWWISLTVFIVIVLASTYKVWLAQNEKLRKIETEFKELRDSIPKYQLEIGELERYSIKKIIDRYEKEIQSIKNKLEQEQKPTSNSGLALFKIAEQIRTAFAFSGSIFGRDETLEEKYKRLNIHIVKLKKYQEKVKHTVKISLWLQASRSDNNVEVTLEADNNSVEMFVDDKYIESNIPESDSPSANTIYAVPSISNIRYKSELYLSGYGKGHLAYSKISKINARKEMSLFNEDFYIYSPSKKFTIKATIHSEKRHEPQQIKLEVDQSESNYHEIDEAD